jgi:hypothetical protein
MFVALVLCSLLNGCKTKNTSFSMPFFEAKDEYSGDRLFKEGYGFNNPNKPRIEDGKRRD